MEDLEQIMRKIHVLFAKCEAYGSEKENKIIVPKKEVFRLLEQLNYAVVKLMDQYEGTEESRERGLGEYRRKGERIIEEAQAGAEDIYAASLLYTDNMINGLEDVLSEARESLRLDYARIAKRLNEQAMMLVTNQQEIKEQLLAMSQGEKYLNLILWENRRRQMKEAEEEDFEEEDWDEEDEDADEDSEEIEDDTEEEDSEDEDSEEIEDDTEEEDDTEGEDGTEEEDDTEDEDGTEDEDDTGDEDDSEAEDNVEAEVDIEGEEDTEGGKGTAGEENAESREGTESKEDTEGGEGTEEEGGTEGRKGTKDKESAGGKEVVKKKTKARKGTKDGEKIKDVLSAEGSETSDSQKPEKKAGKPNGKKKKSGQKQGSKSGKSKNKKRAVPDLEREWEEEQRQRSARKVGTALYQDVGQPYDPPPKKVSYEIKVNEAYFEQLGEGKVDLDAEYEQWKREQEGEVEGSDAAEDTAAAAEETVGKKKRRWFGRKKP